MHGIFEDNKCFKKEIWDHEAPELPEDIPRQFFERRRAKKESADKKEQRDVVGIDKGIQRAGILSVVSDVNGENG